LTPRFRDWFYPIGLTVLIYSTLPVGPWIINFFNNYIAKGYLSFSINLLLLIIGIVLFLICVIRFKTREPIRYLWLLAIFLAAFDIIQIPGSPAERIHFLEYAIVGIFWWRALGYYSINGRQIYFTAFLLTSSLGCLDEMIQFFLPNRFYGYDDMIRNVSGAAMGLAYWGLVERKKLAG
jgi:VanZ family protein